MERVAGEYKRRTQLNCFLIGLTIAALFNIDSFHLFKTLWENPAFAAALTAPPSQNVTNAFQGLQTLPIGWITFPNELTPVDWTLKGAGWLVTASSVLFGAPFWFDLLQNFAQIRGTGRKPNVPS
jgi:hypothetical protein